MKSAITLASSLLAGAALLLSAAPAIAGSDVQWAVTVGSHGHYAPPVVSYAPPPRVVYVEPRPVYVRPRPVYGQSVTVVEYGGRPGYGERRWHDHRRHGERHWDRDDRHERHDRHHRQDRRDYRY